MGGRSKTLATEKRIGKREYGGEKWTNVLGE